MRKMWQTIVLYLVVLFSSPLADGQSTCDSDAPYNCDVVGSLSSCNWTFESQDWTYDNDTAVFGTSGNSTANVTSRTACSTGGNEHCLQVRYLFNVSNTSIRVLLIRVRDENNGDESTSGEQVKALNAIDSVIGVWYTASIPIQSKDNFNITIEANKSTQNFGNIVIYYIHYIKGPCSHVSKGASNVVGVVVGAVVAVIVIVVAVVMFILYRRKRLYLWKTCFRNQNEKETTGTSQNGERSNGKLDGRALNSFNTTQTASGYINHALTASESLPSDPYYSVIKDTDGSGDSAAPRYCTMQESQSADSKTLANASKLTDDHPYKIKTENEHLSSRSAAARYANSNANLKGKTYINGNHLLPASDGGNRQAPADYSLARDTGDEATGVYHCLEEDPNNHGEGGDTGLYHYAKDPDMNPEAGADAKGVYHILEENPAISRDDQSLGVYHEPKVEQMGQQTAKVSTGHVQTGNYNTLDFAGKTSGQMENEYASGGVYNHLNAGSDDPYNEVDREKRAEVIDGEYSHIK